MTVVERGERALLREGFLFFIRGGKDSIQIEELAMRRG